MKICFFGVGGVGGYYGALMTRHLDAAGTGSVYFVARGAHGDTIAERGLLLKKDGGREEVLVKPYLCSHTAHGLPHFDIIIVSVKGYDLADAARDIAGVTGSDSVVLPLLNGADIYERMREHVTNGYILPSCLYLGTHIESPGVIFQMGGSGQIFMGKDPMHPQYYPGGLIDLFRKAGISVEFSGNVYVEIWQKYIFIGAFALVTATFRRTIGEAAQDEKLAALVRGIMQEMASIAKALGVPLPPDVVETSFMKAHQFPFETKTSFQRDVETKGRQSEWDLLGGTVIRYGEKLGVPVNNTKMVLDKLLQGL